jgi:hypothetical protein
MRLGCETEFGFLAPLAAHDVVGLAFAQRGVRARQVGDVQQQAFDLVHDRVSFGLNRRFRVTQLRQRGLGGVRVDRDCAQQVGQVFGWSKLRVFLAAAHPRAERLVGLVQCGLAAFGIVGFRAPVGVKFDDFVNRSRVSVAPGEAQLHTFGVIADEFDVDHGPP